MLPRTDAMTIIMAAFAGLAGKQILDIGCGKGILAHSLSARGAHVVGIDPSSEALAVARQAVPTGTFHLAGAEAMPFADRSFDGAVFLNSLHHVPKVAMHRALLEAERIVKHAGLTVIIEPLAEGSLFSMLRIVEDETDVRTAAQEAIDAALEDGTFEQLGRTNYLRCEEYTDLNQFLDHLVAVNPARAAVVEERRPEVEAAFRRYAQLAVHGRMILEQPMCARVLAARFKGRAKFQKRSKPPEPRAL